MAELPQLSASVQIGGGGGGQTGGARSAGSGLVALGRGIESMTQDFAEFFRETQKQEEITNANLMASEKMIKFNEEMAQVRLNTADPAELHKETNRLLKGLITVSAEEQKVLGKYGIQHFSQTMGSQAISRSLEAYDYLSKYTIEHTRDNAFAAVDVMVRDLGANPSPERVAQMTEYFEQMSPTIFPEKEQFKLKAFDRAKYAVALREAHDLPQEAQRKLNNPNGYATAIDGTLLRMSPEQREKVQTEIDQAMSRENTIRKEREAQEKLRLDEQRRLAKNQITAEIIAGKDWQGTLQMFYAPPGQGMMSPPSITSEDVEGAYKFDAWIREQRAKGGPDNAEQETRVMVKVTDGTVSDVNEIIADPLLSWTQKQRMAEKLASLQEKRQEQGRSGFERKVKEGKAYIRDAFGKRQGLIAAVDPEGEKLVADFILAYDSLMEAQYEKVRGDHPNRGKEFVSAVEGLKPQEAAVQFVTEKIKSPGVREGRVEASIGVLHDMMQPYLSATTDFGTAVSKDVKDGKLTGVQAQLLYQMREYAYAKGWTLEDLRQGRVRPAGDQAKPSGETGGNLRKLMEEFLGWLWGLVPGGGQ